MILRNWYNLLAAYTLNKMSSDTVTFGDGHINWKDVYGTIREFYGVSTYEREDAPSFGRINNYNSPNREYKTFGLIFGSGNTAVTFDDYQMANEISSGITLATPQWATPAYDSATKKFTGSVSCVITNTGSESVEIKEVGLKAQISYTFAYVSYALIYREVLDTPFTIAAGESVNYTQNLEFTMPTV